MNQINHENIMLYLAEMYKDKKERIESKKESSKKNYLLDSDEEYVRFIDFMVSFMPLEFERIIKNDYLEKRKVKWWLEFYTKSTYYRRKREAVKLFVDCLSL